MKTKLVAVIALIFCAFMAEASKVEGNGKQVTFTKICFNCNNITK